MCLFILDWCITGLTRRFGPVSMEDNHGKNVPQYEHRICSHHLVFSHWRKTLYPKCQLLGRFLSHLRFYHSNIERQRFAYQYIAHGSICKIQGGCSYPHPRSKMRDPLLWHLIYQGIDDDSCLGRNPGTFTGFLIRLDSPTLDRGKLTQTYSAKGETFKIRDAFPCVPLSHMSDFRTAEFANFTTSILSQTPATGRTRDSFPWPGAGSPKPGTWRPGGRNGFAASPNLVFAEVDVVVPDDREATRFHPRGAKQHGVSQREEHLSFEQRGDVVSARLAVVKLDLEPVAFQSLDAANSGMRHVAHSKGGRLVKCRFSPCPLARCPRNSHPKLV